MLWLAGFAIVALTVSCCPRLAPAPNPHYVSKRSTAATSSTNNSSSSSSSSSLKSSSDPNKAAASDGAPGTPDEKRALLASKHSKRVTSVIVRPNKVFGTKLWEIAERDLDPKTRVPHFVLRAVARLSSEEALKTEGLFRISGEQDVVHHIRNLFDAAVQDNVALESFEVHDVASALKLFLRQLPDPLLTRRLFQPLVDVSKACPVDDEVFVRKLRLELKSLPPSHVAILRVLCPLLQQVTEYSQINKMTAENLAIVFGPVLLDAPSQSPLAFLNERQHVFRIVRILIEVHDFVL